MCTFKNLSTLFVVCSHFSGVEESPEWRLNYRVSGPRKSVSDLTTADVHAPKDAHGANARCPLMRVGVELTYN